MHRDPCPMLPLEEPTRLSRGHGKPASCGHPGKGPYAVFCSQGRAPRHAAPFLGLPVQGATHPAAGSLTGPHCPGPRLVPGTGRASLGTLFLTRRLTMALSPLASLFLQPNPRR